jgi:hypothetical protein
MDARPASPQVLSRHFFAPNFQIFSLHHINSNQAHGPVYKNIENQQREPEGLLSIIYSSRGKWAFKR